MTKSMDRCASELSPLKLLLISSLLAFSGSLFAYPGSVSIIGYVVDDQGWEACEAGSPTGGCFPSENILNQQGGTNKVIGWTTYEFIENNLPGGEWTYDETTGPTECREDTSTYSYRNCNSTWYVYIYPGECPEGYTASSGELSCVLADDVAEEKSNGGSCTAVANPINFSNGNKYQFDEDFTGTGLLPFQLHRHYNSTSGWSFMEAIAIEDAQSSSKVYECLYSDDGTNQMLDCTYADQQVVTGVVASVTMADGKTLEFGGNSASGPWTAQADISEQLETIGTAQDPIYKYTDDNDLVYQFDASFKLTEKQHRSGQSHLYTYTNNDIEISDSFGKSVFLDFNAGDQLAGFEDPKGNLYTYSHSATAGFSAAVRPDGTYRLYYYSDTNHPTALTNIYDENRNLMASWQYDSEGRAYWSEHNYGLEISQIDYSYLDDEIDPRVTVTNPLGKQTTYHLEEFYGVQKVSSVEGHASANCAASNMSYSYDSNGFVTSQTDWNGNVTNFVRDNEGRQTSRTEAVGTAEQRTTTTEWHAVFNLIAAVQTENRRIEFAYDSNGNLTSQTEIPQN